MSFLFNIDKSNENRTVYTIFGIKLSIYNDNSIIGYLLSPLQKLCRVIKIRNFIKNHNKYNNRKDKSIKKRLVMTTGNISLINAIAAMKQISKPDDNIQYEDYLYIWSININKEFRECCDKIASLHPFKKIYYFEDSFKKQLNAFSQRYHNLWLMDDFLRLNLYDFDEIISTNVTQYMKLIEKLYPEKKFYLIDESAFGRFPKGTCKYNNVINFIMPKYSEKIDYMGFDFETAKKIVDLEKDEFLKVSNKCVEFYPIEIDIKQENKVIIFCGTWGAIDNYSTKDIHDIEIKIIDTLTQKGYTILYKPHPRDITHYEETENFKLLKTRLPLECYPFENAVATVSLLSFSSMQSYYFNKLPGFICMNQMKLKDDRPRTFIREYSPPIEDILDINPAEYSFRELKDLITKRYLEFYERKPMLSENKTMLNIYNKD